MGELELFDKWASNDTPKIGILPSESKYILIKFSEQCLQKKSYVSVCSLSPDQEGMPKLWGGVG